MLTTNTDVLDQLDHSTDGEPEPAPRRGEWTDAQSSVSEAAQFCHSLAVALNATAFSMLFCAPLGEVRKLVPVFDSAFPGISTLSRALTAAASEAACLSAAPTPAWWRPVEEPPFLTATARRWAREVASPVEGPSGIAFPVSVERGRSGIVVFTGEDMILDEVALCETHARCHAVFAGVVRNRAVRGEAGPTMSKREIECLRLTANGLTSDDIATALGLSVHTANQYLTNSTHKLNAVNRIHAVAKALRRGLID
jgi:DNA-binding CsgD family transcriptional regulator